MCVFHSQIQRALAGAWEWNLLGAQSDTANSQLQFNMEPVLIDIVVTNWNLNTVQNQVIYFFIRLFIHTST